jgi:hypothetical protein
MVRDRRTTPFRRARVLAMVALLVLVPLAARAQQANTAVIVGTVVDASDAAIPGATVALAHGDTNATSTVITDERGQYRTAPLRIGEYSVTVELPGFKTFVQRGVVLNIGDVRKVDARLQLGDVSEQITVAAAVPLLSTVDSTVGTVITNRQIKDLPLNGRDYLQLASLSAGTLPTSGVGVSIGGQAGSQVAFLLDGQDNNNQQISTGHSGQKEVVKPSVDAIQEFKVVTNGYAAEYGRSSSGVVSVSLKSGTNTLQGTVYEYFRHDALDAKNFFATEKPPYKRNQFGGAAGFPLVRNRTFFFGDIERGVLRRSSTMVSTLPTLAARNGQFANVRDPLTGQPFAGGQIPASRIDPVAARILSYIPEPQTAGQTNNFIYNSPSNQDALKGDFRVDQIISSNQNLYFRYGYQKTDNAVTSPLPPDAGGNYYAGGGNDVSTSQSWVFVHNKIWSPTLISSVRAGWNEIAWTNILPDQALKGVGIPGVNESNPGFSQINITGYRALGVTNVPNQDDSWNRQISADITSTRGAHTFKGGVQAYLLGIDFLSSQRSSGIFSFNGQYTGNAFADFLLGYASSANLSKYATLNFRSPYTHFFAQDDWRVTRSLTLNLGLRYELSPPAVDAHDAIANYDLDTDPASPRLVLAGAEGRGLASRALQGVNYKQFAPRAGFAYSLPGDKTVVRGGYGIFYANLITLGGMQSMEINPPNHVRINQTTSAASPTIFLNQGFAADALSPASARNVTLISYDRSNKTPTAYQWNLNVQRELPGQVVVELGYNTNRLENDWRQIDGNPAPAGPGDINARRRFTSAVVPGTGDVISLSNVVRIQKDGWSRYRALQTKVEKRYSKGVSVMASYAWSRTTALGNFFQNVDDIDAEVALADTDRTHYFVGSGVWELPFGHDRAIGRTWGGVANAAVGGWSLSPIVTIASGAPLNLTVNGNPANTGQNDRPNVVGDWELDDPTPDRWFNTDAFVANDRYTFGTAPRNLLRGPGSFNLDLVLKKSFKVNGRLTADLRFESFNATNTPPLGNPNTQVGNVNFGRISSAGAARSNQVALKLAF